MTPTQLMAAHELTHVSNLSHFLYLPMKPGLGILHKSSSAPGTDCQRSCAAMSKSMLVSRLKEAEDRLLTTRQEEVMTILVQTKIKLAQADYANLELTVSQFLSYKPSSLPPPPPGGSSRGHLW